MYRSMEEETPPKRLRSDYCMKLVSTMRDFYLQDEYCDVSIQVGSHCFKCHRFVLASFSEYFHGMFGGNFAERRTGKDEPIVLHDVDEEAFKLIINFMYTGILEITPTNVSSVLITADFFKLRNSCIETECAKFFQQNVLSPEPIPDAIRVFKHFSAIKKVALADLSRRYICQNLRRLSTDDTFRSITYEDLIELLQHVYPFWLCNQSEVLKFIVGWVHQSPNERRQYFKELMKLVNMRNISFRWVPFLLNELIDRYGKDEIANNDRFQLISHLPKVDNAESGNIFTTVLNNFSTLNVSRKFLSMPNAIHELSWRIKICKMDDDDLGVYLQCDGQLEKKNWRCFVKFEISILSQRKEVPNITQKEAAGRMFSRREFSRGWTNFAPWNLVTDPEKGYINDDIVIFEAFVNPEPVHYL